MGSAGDDLDEPCRPHTGSDTDPGRQTEDPGLEPLQRLDPLLEVVVAAMQLLVGAALLGGEVPHRARHVVDAAAQRVESRGHAPLLLDDLESGVRGCHGLAAPTVAARSM